MPRIPISVAISFGKDQEKNICNTLHEMQIKKQIISYTTSSVDEEPDYIKFDIRFSNAYYIYVFGHNQGKQGIKEIINSI